MIHFEDFRRPCELLWDVELSCRSGCPAYRCGPECEERRRLAERAVLDVAYKLRPHRLGHGPQPQAKSVDMVDIKVGPQVMPRMRANDGGRPTVRMGESAWAQERYMWLVEELFGRCEWHENPDDPVMFIAVRNGEPVAVVMHYRTDGKDAVPFESAADDLAEERVAHESTRYMLECERHEHEDAKRAAKAEEKPAEDRVVRVGDVWDHVLSHERRIAEITENGLGDTWAIDTSGTWCMRIAGDGTPDHSQKDWTLVSRKAER